jgi:hypothetical protein
MIRRKIQPTFGQLPFLTNLKDGEIKINTDFRERYVAAVADWLGSHMPPGLQD